MTYEEALVLLEELRGHGRAPFSVQQKQVIQDIYPVITGRKFRKTSCPRCWHDAVIEMTVKSRKKDNKMAVQCNYHMRAGFIIRHKDINNGTIYTNANLTDEVAEKYLSMFPGKASMFDRIPEKTEEPAQEPAESVSEPEQEVNQPTEEKPKKGGSSRKSGKKK